MSFTNYDTFQGPPPAEDAGAPGAGGPPPQQPQMGQPMENATGQFPGPNAGAPGAPGGDQPGPDSKTTLWYDESSLERIMLGAFANCHCSISAFTSLSQVLPAFLHFY